MSACKFESRRSFPQLLGFATTPNAGAKEIPQVALPPVQHLSVRKESNKLRSRDPGDGDAVTCAGFVDNPSADAEITVLSSVTQEKDRMKEKK